MQRLKGKGKGKEGKEEEEEEEEGSGEQVAFVGKQAIMPLFLPQTTTTPRLGMGLLE